MALGSPRAKEVKTDAIAIVEAAYDLEGDEGAWLGCLLDRMAPRLDRGLGIAATMFHPTSGVDESRTVTRGMEDRVIAVLANGARALPEIARRVHAFAAPLATATQNLGMTEKEAETFPPFVEMVHPVGVHDMLALGVADVEGRVLTFSAPMADVRRPAKKEVALWSQIAAHLAAGVRLRRGLCGGTSRDVAEGAEAVLSPSGGVLHAEPAAQGSRARESLRRAVEAIDRARGPSRSDEQEALALWEGLVSGRWSLIDRFDTDGRRFVVARRNDPQVSDPRAVTLRERQVLAYAARGFPLKRIAYALGLSLTTVSAQRLSGMRKLGLRTQADLVGVFCATHAGDAEPPGSGLLQPAEDRDKLGT